MILLAANHCKCSNCSHSFCSYIQRVVVKSSPMLFAHGYAADLWSQICGVSKYDEAPQVWRKPQRRRLQNVHKDNAFFNTRYQMNYSVGGPHHFKWIGINTGFVIFVLNDTHHWSRLSTTSESNPVLLLFLPALATRCALIMCVLRF